MNKITEKEALCFLQSLDGFTKAIIKKLFFEFNSYTNIATATRKELAKFLTSKEIDTLISKRETTGISFELSHLNSLGIALCLPSDRDFPTKLKNIPDSPISLYIKGKLPNEHSPSIAIIGARNCSSYGSNMAKIFARELAASHIQIISGLARGIDGIAQEETLLSGGYTCGVLGCGIDICYPRENERLYEALSIHGGLISEYPLGTKPLPFLFPQRNRIISGLSDAIIVIEARAKSGTLITVNMALEQGRDIYALPGRLCDNLSYGCNMLIKDGAIPLINPSDFVKEFIEDYNKSSQQYNASYVSSKTENNTDKSKFTDCEELLLEDKLIMSSLDFHPKSINEIYHPLKQHFSLPALMTKLTNLTIQGKIKCTCGSNYYIDKI